MSKKYKIVVAVISSLLILLIIGLGIGLVLVAQQVQMSNNVTIKYRADNVECDIAAYAIHFTKASHGGDITDYDYENLDEFDSNIGNVVQLIVSEDPIEKANYAIDHILPHHGANQSVYEMERTFDHVDLVPVVNGNTTKSSEVFYYFAITAKTKPLVVSLSYDESATKDNMEVEFGFTHGLDEPIPAGTTYVYWFKIYIIDLEADANFSGALIMDISNAA